MNQNEFNTIASIVSNEYGLQPFLLGSKLRYKRFVEARNIVQWILRNKGLSYPKIGRLTRRHHAVVINGVREVEKRMSKDKEFREKISSICMKIQDSAQLD